MGVSPEDALFEAQQIVAIGKQYPRLLGIVAATLLEYGDWARFQLEALQALGPLIKGVRRNLQHEHPRFCLQPAFIQGVQCLTAYGMSCDLCIRETHLPAIIELVQQCPHVTFILDHLGKPAVQHQRFEPWCGQLQSFAAFPNVACKISGLVTEADLLHWQVEDLEPYVSHALAVFGPERVMFGSDWPLVTLGATLRRWINTLDTLTQHLPQAQRRALCADNARHWYRLASVEMLGQPA